VAIILNGLLPSSFTPSPDFAASAFNFYRFDVDQSVGYLLMRRSEYAGNCGLMDFHSPGDFGLIIFLKMGQAQNFEFVKVQGYPFKLINWFALRAETPLPRFASDPACFFRPQNVPLFPLCIHMHYRIQKYFVNNGCRWAI
jgi:hypothetical protein